MKRPLKYLENKIGLKNKFSKIFLYKSEFLLYNKNNKDNDYCFNIISE